MQDKVVFNIEEWSYQNYADYLRAVSSNDFRLALHILRPIIVSWSFDIDLSEKNAHEKIKFTRLPALIRGISSTIETYVDSLDVDTVKIDLDKWSMVDFFDFGDAGEDHNIKEMERLMKLVAMVEGQPNTNDIRGTDPYRLSFYEGVIMAKAITEANKQLFSAGE